MILRYMGTLGNGPRRFVQTLHYRLDAANETIQIGPAALEKSLIRRTYIKIICHPELNHTFVTFISYRTVDRVTKKK